MAEGAGLIFLFDGFGVLGTWGTLGDVGVGVDGRSGLLSDSSFEEDSSVLDRFMLD